MSEQEFDAYLRLMGRFLHMNDAQRQTLGRELRGHMEERLDELLARGYSREDAISTILDEFGDAAALAGEFGRIGNRRNWIMRTTAGTAAIAATVLFVSFLLPENRPLSAPSYSHAGQPVMSEAENSASLIMAASKASDAKAAGLTAWPELESPADQQTKEKLASTKISLNFAEGTSFEELLEYLRGQSGIQLSVNWTALAGIGIDKTRDTLGMSLRDISLKDALDLLLDNVGGENAPLDYTIINGTVRISTRDNLDRKTLVRVYDVKDLVVSSPTEISQSASAIMRDVPPTPKDDSVRSSLLAQFEVARGVLEQQRANELINLITTTIDPDSWQTTVTSKPSSRLRGMTPGMSAPGEFGGGGGGRGSGGGGYGGGGGMAESQPSRSEPVGAINHYNGLLVIKHNVATQQKITALLSTMRQALAARPQAPATQLRSATPAATSGDAVASADVKLMPGLSGGSPRTSTRPE